MPSYLKSHFAVNNELEPLTNLSEMIDVIVAHGLIQRCISGVSSGFGDKKIAHFPLGTPLDLLIELIGSLTVWGE